MYGIPVLAFQLKSFCVRFNLNLNLLTTHQLIFLQCCLRHSRPSFLPYLLLFVMCCVSVCNRMFVFVWGHYCFIIDSSRVYRNYYVAVLMQISWSTSSFNVTCFTTNFACSVDVFSKFLYVEQIFSIKASILQLYISTVLSGVTLKTD